MLDTIYKAINFLCNEQLETGEFHSEKYFNRELAGEGVFDSSPFTTAIVLYGLSFCSHTLLNSIQEKAYRYLEAEQEGPGLWRYWSSDNENTIAPDLDDICCISFLVENAPVRFRRELFNKELLIRNRHNPSGLFFTWIKPEGEDNDVDGIVNANVLMYLGENEDTVPARDILIEAILEDREPLAYWYYLDDLSLYYAISRARFHGVTGFDKCRQAIIEKTEKKVTDAHIDLSELQLALAACIFLNFEKHGHPFLHHAINQLVALQQEDGGWAKCAYYTGPEPPYPHTVFWGSKVMTTGVCIEAIARFQKVSDGNW